jgi:hypothetical protein
VECEQGFGRQLHGHRGAQLGSFFDQAALASDADERLARFDKELFVGREGTIPRSIGKAVVNDYAARLSEVRPNRREDASGRLVNVDVEQDDRDRRDPTPVEFGGIPRYV